MKLNLMKSTCFDFIQLLRSCTIVQIAAPHFMRSYSYLSAFGGFGNITKFNNLTNKQTNKMKVKQTIIPMLFVSISISLMTSCGNKKAVQNKNNNDSLQTDNHEHIFSCPMHPEVRGKEGDKCPKCNMPLEHMDNLEGNGKSYFMRLSSNPTEAESQKSVVLSFTPTEKGNESTQVPLDVEMEKKLHLIIVSEDLDFFDHQHPEYQPSGSYDLAYTFPTGGNYLLFAGYKPTGAEDMTDKLPVSVKGKIKAKVTFTKEKLEDTEGDFKVQLKPESGMFMTGTTMHINAPITKKGKELKADELDNYLGMKAHVVMIGINDKSYLHVHPDVENGVLDLHASFDKAGMYRAWVQFQYQGKIYVTDFVLNVMQGTETTGDDKNKMEHNH